MALLIEKTMSLLSRIGFIFKKRRIVIPLMSVVLASVIALSVIIVSAKSTNNTSLDNSKENNIVSTEEITESNIEEASSESESSEEFLSSSSEAVSSVASKVTSSTSSKKVTSATASKPVVTKPVVTTKEYKPNGNSDINDNVFLDAMVYTGYNLKKHIADGNMWVYILASRKRGMGYLSKIGYAGGSSGYETKNGLPDIKYFEKKGLVCASYVTYVYFNYLPNVAGIDTSSLTKPNKSYSANDWYIAAKDWVKKGYSRTISFKASKTSSGYINFKPSEEIPIGSLMFCCDAKKRSDFCSHVSIYAGYANGYHWVTHVGNENGPEFCAMERMHFGPDPQWPINIITTPKNIRMDAALEITLRDDSANPIPSAEFILRNLKTGKTYNLGKTDAKGIIVKENLPYGKYELTQTALKDYNIKQLKQTVELKTANNSYNKISITNIKIKKEPVVSETASSAASSVVSSSSAAESSSSQVSSATSSVISSSEPPVSSETESSEVSSNQSSASSDSTPLDTQSAVSSKDVSSQSEDNISQ